MNYYQISKKASSEIGSHRGLRYLQKHIATSRRVLDVGCGEGTRLHTLLPSGKSGWGIDPSQKAVKQGAKQYPHLHFRLGTGEDLPYPDARFDLVYSAFAIEHCRQPEKFISEMLRVCRPRGRVVILAPNYGAPNRRSPNSGESPYNKFLEGLLKDFFPHPGLDWRQVTPQEGYSRIDADTTWEPYLHSLVLYLKKYSDSVENWSSLWDLEEKSGSPRKKIIAGLGRLGVFPFSYWGPQLFVSAVK